MKLRSFRVQNYRCIDDSGEAPVEHIKALVGKNESGKTTILKALHKFNPATPEPFNGLKEFPRRRFHEYEDKATVVELKFSLDHEEREVLSQIDPRLEEVSGASVTRDYAGRYAVDTARHTNSTPKPERSLSPPHPAPRRNRQAR